MLRPGATSLVHASPFAVAVRFAVVLTSLPLLTGPASAKTVVMPHVLETKGSTSSTPYTFDSFVYLTYGDRPGATGQGATADLYLYDNSGQPMQSQTATDVCNPCTYNMGGANPRKHSISIEDLIVAAGDFAGVKLGFGVVVIGGADPDAVGVQEFVVNAHTSAFDLSVAPLEPIEAGPGGGGGGSVKTYVVPHVFETAGRTTDTQYTFDTTLFMTYTAGLAGLPGGPGAAVDLYLLDDAGAFLNGGGGGPVCAPCSFALSDLARKQTVSLETLIDNAGGFGGSAVLSGYAIMEVSGDPDHVSTTGLVANAHASAFDLSVFGFSPQEISAPGRVAVEPAPIRQRRISLSASPNPVRTSGEGVALAFELADEATVELSIHDVNGREVVMLARGALAAGAHRVVWDGRDAAGKSVPPGVYFARLADDSGLESSRIVAIR